MVEKLNSNFSSCKAKSRDPKLATNDSNSVNNSRSDSIFGKDKKKADQTISGLKLEKKEMTEKGTKNGKETVKQLDSGKYDPDKAPAYMEKDKDGILSVDSGVAYSKETLKYSDADADGKVTTEEAGPTGELTDADGDELISPEENTSKKFVQDKDKNGKVNKAEYDEFDKKVEEDPDCVAQEIKKVHSDLFGKPEADKIISDLKTEKKEMTEKGTKNGKETVKQLDSGKYDPDKAPAYMEKDKDGILSVDSGVAYSKETLKYSDADADGKVTTEEAGPTGELTDADGDGLISPEENTSKKFVQDKDKNGKVNKAEYDEFDKKVEEDPENITQEIKKAFTDLFGKKDKPENEEKPSNLNDSFISFFKMFLDFIMNMMKN